MLLLAAALSMCTITDGDTVRCGNERVRLVGIDAPELHGRCPYETALAYRAKARLAELIAGGVVLHRQGVDRYHRTLAVVTVNGRDVGTVLIAEGLARVWTGRRLPWC